MATNSRIADQRDKRLLRSITLRNLLSFGPDTEPLELRPLNVLIGPNGSGKSNLIEAISLLRASPGDMSAVPRKGGGIAEWIWKGDPGGKACIDAKISHPTGLQTFRHFLQFGVKNQNYWLCDERIEDADVSTGRDNGQVYHEHNSATTKLANELFGSSLNPNHSVLSQRRDPENYPVLFYLAYVYSNIRIYREWVFGKKAVFRDQQMADMRNSPLEEDFSNLGLFLSYLRRSPQTKRAILKLLPDIYDGLDDFEIDVMGGAVQVSFTEGDFRIPATRLSDGTLRYLCLLAILCDPEPTSLICIEEPELGLHPDILPKLADLLIEASTRTQLIVTTHSEILVDALTENPESVIVCEKREGQTKMTRLKSAELSEWLERYRLGQLWLKGGIGGTRW